MKPLLAFDLDGTLIDSAGDIVDAVNITLQRYNKPALAHDLIVSHIGDGLRKLISDFFPEYHQLPHRLHEVELEFLVIYEKQMFNKTKIFPGVVDFLQAWQGPLGIITNKNEAPAKALVTHLGLDRFRWVEILGADSLSEKKPSPLPLQTMMRLAERTPAQTLMIGDGTPDMLSAQRAGVKSLAIGFGYTDRTILQKYQPSAFLESYADLERAVTALGLDRV